ncbi:MAG: hypothetical protein KGR26_03590 [Cyanobacteria bacterium REEB65]|nr:hypothetical protein [Cyanobacteria bacterium REEB65]
MDDTKPVAFALGRRLACIGSTMALVLWAWPARAHGVVGDRMFMEPFVAEDANPANECDILVPSWQQGQAFGEDFAIEKTLLPSLSLALTGHWTGPIPGTSASFDNPGVELKSSLYESDGHEFITSLGLSAAPPILMALGGDTSWSLGPVWSFAKGFGDLPDSAGALRAFMLQGDVDGDVPIGSGDKNLHVNLALAYSLPYLQQEVQYLGIPAPFSDLLPQVEVDLTRTLSGPDAGQFTGTALPGVMWIGSYTELGVAAVVPLNGASGGYGAMAILDLFLDDIFPSTYGKPLLGRN